MKKIILLIFLVLALASPSPSPSWAAISAATVWEVRTTGSQNNGGGFVTGASGTDYSQQAAAQLSLTDLASAGDWLTITSATGGFTAAMIGNLIHITAATGSVTAGWYQILTRADTNTITVDRATGTGNWTAGTGKIGGAFKLGGTLDTPWVENIQPGNKIYIASGIYTGVYALGSLNGLIGTWLNPINWYGYITTRSTVPYGDDRPLLDFGTSGQNIHLEGWHRFRNLRINGNLNNYLVEMWGGTLIDNCKITNTNAGASAYALWLQGSNSKVINSEISSAATGAGGYTFGNYIGANNRIFGNYIHGGSVCVYMSAMTGALIANNIISGCTTGILDNNRYDNTSIIGNTIYGAATPTGSSVGISITAPRSNSYPEVYTIMNNIIYGWVTGISVSPLGPDYYDYNDFYNNTTDRSDPTTMTGAHDLALDPQFVSPSTGDFRIGTNLKGKGFPSLFPGASASGLGYVDIGAVQRKEQFMGAWF